MRRIFATLLCSTLLACTSQVKEGIKTSSKPIDSLEIHYAKGFAVNYYEDYKELLVFSSDRKDTLHRYYLSTEAKEGFVQTPIKRLASLSSVYAAYIEELGLEESLVAVDEKNYINSESILKEMETREIVELGSLEKVNHEALLMAQADLIYTFGWQGGLAGIEDKYPNITFALCLRIPRRATFGKSRVD